MRRNALTLAAAALAILITGAEIVEAQKSGGTLRVYHRDSPASMSIHEEGTVGVIMPMMGVFDNLMIYDQHIEKNNIGTIVPELATGPAWNADGTALTGSSTACSAPPTVALSPSRCSTVTPAIRKLWRRKSRSYPP